MEERERLGKQKTRRAGNGASERQSGCGWRACGRQREKPRADRLEVHCSKGHHRFSLRIIVISLGTKTGPEAIKTNASSSRIAA